MRIPDLTEIHFSGVHGYWIWGQDLTRDSLVWSSMEDPRDIQGAPTLASFQPSGYVTFEHRNIRVLSFRRKLQLRKMKKKLRSVQCHYLNLKVTSVMEKMIRRRYVDKDVLTQALLDDQHLQEDIIQDNGHPNQECMFTRPDP